ncbi:hypothetical protein BU23DRAFT_552600 [Bimuria novae-zelandiae CBS 107.79]|uniref:GPI anchored cell wall protein n=1 Tax=Bimuria novae-zelandiae CBS 107.79 TaxID=1447943 RepID=A0A6A5VFM3_9PLEO|nr:hypothetical protein BU23DRAFT_552600 [Bimuria novae-zelandiae CBS 107.79]
MKGFTFAATFAALAATSFAATVKIEQTQCLQANTTALPSFDVEVDKLTAIELPSVCGLKITSVDGADEKSVKCQAYKDAEGKEKGSAEFTVDKPAQIGTNPRQIAAVLCIGSGDVPSAQPTTFAVVSTAVAAGPTGGASPTGGNSTSPTSPTAPSSPTSSSSDPANGNSASTLGMSFGALSAAAIAMLFL